MKKLFLSLAFLLIISLNCLAQDFVEFDSPDDDDVYTIPTGATTINITVNFSYHTNKQSYYFKLTTEQGTVTITNGYTVNNVTGGSKNWKIEMFMYDGQYTTSVQDYVDFSVGYGPREITVDNNFVDNSGNSTRGTVVIDYVSRTIPSDGYDITKNVGQNLRLEAISPQTDNQGYQRIWNTSVCETSDWTRANIHKTYNQIYSFTVSGDDDGKRYMANLAQVHTTTSGTMSSDETWITNVTLSNNVTVPSGVTLDLTSCATVNLNGNSIISTGGTIVKQSGATINGLKAELYSGSTLKGLCSSIQSAVSNI